MTVGEKITYFRNMKHYFVNKLANLAGISQSHFRDIELLNKNPTIEILTYICDALYQKIFLLTLSQKASLTIFLDTMINQGKNSLTQRLYGTFRPASENILFFMRTQNL